MARNRYKLDQFKGFDSLIQIEAGLHFEPAKKGLEGAESPVEVYTSYMGVKHIGSDLAEARHASPAEIKAYMEDISDDGRG